MQTKTRVNSRVSHKDFTNKTKLCFNNILSLTPFLLNTDNKTIKNLNAPFKFKNLKNISSVLLSLKTTRG